MGAFDGLNFYQQCYSRNYHEEPTDLSVDSKPSVRTEWYVSWDGSNGGATGKWFDKYEDAISCFNEKKDDGKNPACWFDIE